MNLTVSYQVFADAILQDVKTLRLWTKRFQTVADFLQMKQFKSNMCFFHRITHYYYHDYHYMLLKKRRL